MSCIHSAGCDVSEAAAEVLLRASLRLQPSMNSDQLSRTMWALAALKLLDPSSSTAFSSALDSAAKSKPLTPVIQKQVSERGVWELVAERQSEVRESLAGQLWVRSSAFFHFQKSTNLTDFGIRLVDLRKIGPAALTWCWNSRGKKIHGSESVVDCG